jgi:uncharacterized protein (DUF362 family)
VKLGNVTFQESVDAERFMEMIRSLKLKPPVIIKPNWGFSVVFTEATVLDWVLTTIDGEALVVESYGWARCEEAITKKEFGSMERTVLQTNDQWFLEYSGLDQVLEKHQVEYLNITEEVWAGRTVAAEEVKSQVEKLFPAVHNEEMYSYVPERLYQMRKGTILSLAKLKFLGRDIGVSLAIKNLFGMIPGPDRSKFHGENNALMNQSILDINKVYHALFPVKGVVEAIFTASRGMSLDQVIYENPKLAWVSEDALELDAVVAAQVGENPHDVGHFTRVAECFGKWDERGVISARKHEIETFYAALDAK